MLDENGKILLFGVSASLGLIVCYQGIKHFIAGINALKKDPDAGMFGFSPDDTSQENVVTNKISRWCEQTYSNVAPKIPGTLSLARASLLGIAMYKSYRATEAGSLLKGTSILAGVVAANKIADFAQRKLNK